MASARSRLVLLLALALVSACASATDRLQEGLVLQSQGRYIEAVYRYADAVEKDRELVEAQDRLLAAGDTAVMVAMDEADEYERRDDPVQAAGRYRQIDQMLARIREVGLRLTLPSDYSMIRRGIFDRAIEWQMAQGDEAMGDGRWADARRFYVGARSDYLPSRDQVEESYDAETRVVLRWAEIELQDGRPRSAYDLADEALTVRTSPARETVLAVRDIQDRALRDGTVVVAVLPVTADPGVREWLGGEFEIQLDEDLALDHWNQPPLFVQMADPIVLRRELRGLLRGQATQSPLIVGRALDLIGADLGVMVSLSGIEVTEEDVDRDRHEAVIPHSSRRSMAYYQGREGAPVGQMERGPETEPGANGRGPDDPGARGRGPEDDPGARGREHEDDPGARGRGPEDDPGARGRGPDDPPTGDPDDPDAGQGGRPPVVSGGARPTMPSGGTAEAPVSDTVQYWTVKGTMKYFVEAEIIMVDPSGREVNRFTAASTQRGPFERGEFDGDPAALRLQGDRARFFDPAVLGGQRAAIEQAVLEELAVAVAAGTYDQILAGIR